MRKYDINKGVGRSLEFKGLRAQYILYLAAGFAASFFVYVILSFTGLTYIAVGMTIVCIIATIGIVFYMNAKYGENGLKQEVAKKKVIKRVYNNKRVYTYLNENTAV